MLSGSSRAEKPECHAECQIAGRTKRLVAPYLELYLWIPAGVAVKVHTSTNRNETPTAEEIMASPREVALVTGAASGIGRAIARKMASRGVNVLIADIQHKPGEEAAAIIRNDFEVDAVFYKADMTREEDIKNMVQATVDRWGRLDWAANNAGRGEMLADNEDDVTI
ncbi:hypothetical protein NM208_g2346 [Fusarium decemcellulare]|uniref:Uncharacterized protein n=1 Tax=Fusarium decemcellulare TaxID=57161 RepID=A0ACC1ST43_9HYPO|nr:hypothetical protein NM208_g2346 [Fusarium decemcellulare]